jgi:hypothetical protein
MLRKGFTRESGSSRDADSEGADSFRLRRHRRWGDEGVASTVGTIMALMVFMAFLSMFTSQYIPIWMEENEASHMSEAYGQLATLKQAVDIQMLAGTIQGTSPIEMFSPVKLGSKGIPMFASPTPGILSISRADSYDNVSFSYNSGFNLTTSVLQDYNTTAGGTIKLSCPNRYYVQQDIAYENDALVLMQPDGEYMKATPQFTVTRSGTNATGHWVYSISYTQVDLRADDTSYIGFGTRGVKTLLKSASTTTFTNLTGAAPAKHPFLYINHTTFYEKGWNATFNQTLTSAGLIWGVDYFIDSIKMPDKEVLDDLYLVSVRIDPAVVSRFTLTVAYIEVSTSELGVE